MSEFKNLTLEVADGIAVLAISRPAAFPVQIQVRIPEEYFQSPSLKSVAFSSHISITLPFSYLLQLNIPTLTAYKALSRNVRSSSVLFQDLRHLPVYRL